ncbi:hypothetical protein BdWA1_000275 [Babesia duncani]|uniref:Uncharacterized protein n=1 Tax=Babesia duncani TaxID=323732 RepID=A0AAD9UPS1_9APIC|nr:hypothetical protein BdWA1_000275 [Babesia duncani]
MKDKPKFDYSGLNFDSFQKYRDFLPKLKSSNDSLLQQENCIIDSDISLCPNEPLGGSTLDCGKITLDVNVGVFNVKKNVLGDEQFKERNITIVDLPENNMVFAEPRDLITELEPSGDCR